MNDRKTFSKRVDIVNVKLVKEKSLLYKHRKIMSPNQAYEFSKQFLEEEDREKLIVISLDTKNQPISLNVASVGTLNSSLVHPREIFKVAILSNAN